MKLPTYPNHRVNKYSLKPFDKMLCVELSDVRNSPVLPCECCVTDDEPSDEDTDSSEQEERC